MHLVVPPGGSFRETRRIELGARALTIGRAPTCDIRIDVPGVDDEHAQISVDALIAVGNDCAIGDVPLDAGCKRLVATGDEIQIGSVVLALDGQAFALPGKAPPKGPRIRVVEGKNAGSEVVLAEEGREYIIGRAKTADLVLEDREVSREHIKVVRRGLSILVHDQASTRGSWLGRSAVYQGSRIEWERPRMLKVGATVLSLDLPYDPSRVPAAVPSAPMTAPPRTPQAQTFTPSPEALAAGPPTSVGVFHYEAKPQSATPSGMPPGMPSGIPPPPSMHPASMPPSISTRTGAQSSRGGFKRQGESLSKTSGLLLLVIAGFVVLGGLLVLFSLME